MSTGILKRGLAMILIALQVFTFIPVYAGEINSQGITMVDESNVYEKTKTTIETLALLTLNSP